MITLIIIVIFGLVFGYFATLNTAPVSIYFWQYSVQGVPLYLAMLASLGVGLLITTAINLVKSLFTSLAMGKKENLLKKSKEEVSDLTKQVHKLEIENTKLKTQLGQDTGDDNSI